MAGVFGKDPNMKRNSHAELERINVERKRKLAAAIKRRYKRLRSQTLPPKLY